MNVIEDNEWSRGFQKLPELWPRPAAIVCVSAHWYVDSTLVTGNTAPRTIHDFSGFPRELYEIQYPAPGDVDLASQIRSLVGPDRVALDDGWGLDHGTWSVVRWMYPDADVPVIQLSIDRTLSDQQHIDIGRSLAELRDDGVLIVGSGNVTHNLRDAFGRRQSGDREIPAWATRFDTAVVEVARERDTARLLALRTSDDGRASHPSPDHYLPLLYAYGASDDRDAASFPIEGFDHSLSMRSIVFSYTG